MLKTKTIISGTGQSELSRSNLQVICSSYPSCLYSPLMQVRRVEECNSYLSWIIRMKMSSDFLFIVEENKEERENFGGVLYLASRCENAWLKIKVVDGERESLCY